MAQVKKGDRVKFNYALTLKDGKVFESNYAAFNFGLRTWVSVPCPRAYAK